MLSVPIHEAKATFSKLIQAAERGEEVVLTRHGKRVARIVADAEPTEDQYAAKEAEALALLQSLRAKYPQPLVELDWKAARDEGRKYI